MENLNWLPIDVPKFSYSREVIRDFKRNYVPPTAKQFWAQKLTEPTIDYSPVRWVGDLTESQKKLANFIDENLPFEYVINVKIHHPRTMGNWHLDFTEPEKNKEIYAHNKITDPCGYRIVLQGNRVGDLEVKTSVGSEVPILPEETDVYVIGHTAVPHRTISINPNRYIVFIHGKVDPDQHQYLLERSLEKYRDFAIWN